METIFVAPHRLNRILGMAIVIIMVLLLAAFLPAPAAHADAGFAYYWSLTFDFNDSINGRLHIVVGHNEDGAPQEPPIYVQDSIVPCKRVGNATLSGGLLKLNGGYLACELELGRALEAAFSQCDAIVSGCAMKIEEKEAYSHFRASADVLATNPGEAPIFYHPNASYAIDVQSSTAQITGSLSPHGLIPSSPQIVFPALGVFHSYEAFYSCEAGCDMDYAVGLLQETVVTANAQISFSTSNEDIFIGRDPISGLVAPAGTQIDNIVVDPPNHGND